LGREPVNWVRCAGDDVNSFFSGIHLPQRIQ
jgi:hypothetical protein